MGTCSTVGRGVPLGSVQNTNAAYEVAHHSTFFAGKMLFIIALALDWASPWVHLASGKGSVYGNTIAHAAKHITTFGLEALKPLAMLAYVLLSAEALIAFNKASADFSRAVPFAPDGYMNKVGDSAAETATTAATDTATSTITITWDRSADYANALYATLRAADQA